MALTLLQAIARQEGFGNPEALATKRNNPGNIIEGKYAQSVGALPPDGNRFAHWASPEGGFAAMRGLLESKVYFKHTLEKILNNWAPPVENQTSIYIKNVAEWMGITPQTQVTTDMIG